MMAFNLEYMRINKTSTDIKYKELTKQQLKNTILVATTLLSFSRHYSSISSAVWKLISPLLQQYQSAIRAHKAGKAVNFEELPVPPGEILF